MHTIKIATRDEIYLIDLRLVAYFKAEDHYTTVYFLNGSKLLVPSGLAKIREKVAATSNEDSVYLQLGRSLLVNKQQVCCLKPTKELVLIHGTNGQMMAVQAPKTALRKAMADFLE